MRSIQLGGYITFPDHPGGAARLDGTRWHRVEGQLCRAEGLLDTRTAATTSIMPDGFERAISIDDLRDLVTFLSSPADADLQ